MFGFEKACGVERFRAEGVFQRSDAVSKTLFLVHDETGERQDGTERDGVFVRRERLLLW